MVVERYSRDLIANQAAKGHLPSISWAYGDGSPPYSEHPLENITLGSGWIRRQIQAIADGGLWPRTGIFVPATIGVGGSAETREFISSNP